MEELIKYEKKILSHESKFNTFRQINKNELEKFQIKLNHYKITINLLLSDSNFYSELKFIELDQSVNINEYVYMDIIWTHEHYEFIEKIRSIEPDIKLLLAKSHKLGLITNVQFKLAKKIFKLINNIFESDSILKDFYVGFNKNNINKNNINNNITYQANESHLEYFFNIIEIIILKMYNIEKIINKENDINLLLYNFNYLNNISKLKKLLEKSLI